MTWRILIVAAMLAVPGCIENPSIAQVADDLNDRLPAMVDSETRLDAITVTGDTMLSYHYTLVNASRDLADTAALRKALWPGLLSHIRVDADMKRLRDERVILRYFYSDKEGKQMVAFTFTPADYL